MTIWVASISISPPIPFALIFSAGEGRFLHPCPAAAKGEGARAVSAPRLGREGQDRNLQGSEDNRMGKLLYFTSLRTDMWT